MIYVRNDDVLAASRAFKNEQCVERFKYVHSEILKYGAMHRPAILLMEIQNFPTAIEFCIQETKEGRMSPQFHGLRHVDYGGLSYEHVVDHLEIAQEFFLSWFGQPFKFFYTPWGGNADYLRDACATVGATLRDCNEDYFPARSVRRDPEASYEKYNEKEIMIHWWEGLGKLTGALKVTQKRENSVE